MEFIKTADGSKTLFHEQAGEHYHSKHGAVRESKHVFLTSGLQFWLDRYQQTDVRILEVGFGTGLNFLIAADFCVKNDIDLRYTGVEKHPLPADLLAKSDYETYVELGIWQSFMEGYASAQNGPTRLQGQVVYDIAVKPILEYTEKEQFDVVFFDAFAEIHQPEMWSFATMSHVASLIKPGGVFVTYAITGNLKRTMKALGFTIEKAPGAPGKREMLRAIKLEQPSEGDWGKNDESIGH